VAKRSSISGLVGGVEVDERMGIPLPAGRGMRGGMDWSGSGEGIPEYFYFYFYFGFGRKSSVREREGLG
jgi:hypothetical protein